MKQTLTLTSALAVILTWCICNPLQASPEKLKELPSPASISWKKNRKLGDRLIQMGSTYNALNYYRESIHKKPTKTFLHQKLADAYFTVRDYKNATSHYKSLMDADSIKLKNPSAIYQYALTQKYLGNYETATVFFNRFITKTGTNDTYADQRKAARREIAGCELGIRWRDSVDFKIYTTSHLNSNVNQPFTDYAPVLFNNNTLYYGAWTSDTLVLEGKKEKYAVFSRIYVAQKGANGWNKAEEVTGGINDVKAHVGNPVFTADGRTMYYTQCLQDEMLQMRCDIYRSRPNGNGWGPGEKLDANVNAAGFTNTHPALGKNEAGEDVLFFASNRNPNKGMDIFYAKLNSDGTFGKAKQAGSAINTRGDEMTPFYDFKTNTLYFSSNGHINMGGADVFKTTVDRGEWVEPENLGMPVNSSVDDMYYGWYASAGEGFVVSNRTGGLGYRSETCCDDILQVQETKVVITLYGNVINEADNTSVSPIVLFVQDEGTTEPLQTIYVQDGSFKVALNKNKVYKIIARKEGFEDKIESYTTQGAVKSDSVRMDVKMKAIKEEPIIGRNIGTVYWEYDRDNLTNGAPDTLRQVVDFMLANPRYVIEVGSHTDSRGTDEYNLKLSERRSQSVVKFLLSKKIPKTSLVVKAYGESKPIAPNENPDGSDNELGRKQNRRTEFRVVEEVK